MDFLFSTLLTLISLLTGWLGEPTIPAPSSESAPVVETALVERVIDGDTILVLLNGESKRVRYIGIDTPELHGQDNEPECYSQEATNRNSVLVDGMTVTLVPDVGDTDRYDRLLRYVYVNDLFVNEVLVREGYAKKLYIKPDVSKYDSIKKAEKTARAENIGLWSACRK